MSIARFLRHKRFCFHNISTISTIILLLFGVLLSHSLTGCQKSGEASALDILLAMQAAESKLPAGDIYVLPDAASLGNSDAAESDSDTRIRIADELLLSAAFGNGENSSNSNEIWELSFDIVNDGAMRLSTTAEPFEWMVFHCVSRSDTDVVAELLLRRLEVLRRQYQGSDAQRIVENGQVIVLKKYVLLIVSTDPESAVEAARVAILKQ